ncbi:MAG: aminoglycoside phosphotransferase family protein [Syntrophales bacterium]
MTMLSQEAASWLREVLSLKADETVELTLLAGGGSDRSFHRVARAGGSSAVLMQYGPEGRENAIFTATARFLRGIGVPVPQIIAEDLKQGFVLLEDAGDADLWSFRDAPWEFRRGLYGKALEAVHRLHGYPRPEEAAGELGLMASFGPDLYRWEREYFLESFVSAVCGIRPAGREREALEEELSALAERMLAVPPCLVHRDFQSQNVMILRGEPVLIDFQGMRLGNPLYDLGSLLYDPYVPLTEDERMEMLFWYAGLGGLPEIAGDDASRFREASVQRLLQAMGAYGFLGLRKGKREFLNHIPRGFLNLADAARRHGGLPRLEDLLTRCREALAERGIHAVA